MKIAELYKEIIEAYSDKNLNKISGKLIALYQGKNYGKIREIANRISKFVTIDEDKDAKCFSKLIMLYHPDKGNLLRKSINELYSKNDLESLSKYSHILLMDNIENVVVTGIDENIDFKPEYVWDENQNDGYSFVNSEELNSEENDDTFNSEKSFYNAIKLREYGKLDIEFPTYYLEDFDEFELTDQGIELLDGVEYCKHVVTLDLSNNEISDISELENLERLEELYLANNQIGYIDVLSSLLNLRELDLSGNQIDDISPLLELNNLEYVNLIGNRITKSQIDKLKEREVFVMY